MRRLLVALKDQPEAQRLPELAARLATAEAEIHVVTVVEHEFADADAYVRAAVDWLRSKHMVAVGHVDPRVEGGVAACLSRRAREAQVELIVMGSRGLGQMGGLFGRSVSHALIATTELPVLVLPASAVMPPDGIRRVLVAVGDVGEVDAAVAAMGLLPRPAEVLAVHVPRLVAVHSGKAGFLESPESSIAVLSRTAKRFAEAGMTIGIRTLPRSTDVARAVTRLAHDWQADLLVLCSRRLGDWEALFAGSTAHDVFRISDRPILIAGAPHGRHE